MKSFFELRESKIFFVRVGKGADSMTVKYKGTNSREVLKKAKSRHFGEPVRLDPNQKQGQPAGALESVEEAYRKPTAAEIAADKAKERRASGSKGPDSSARYKNIKKKMYGNAMGGLKKEESEATESTDNYGKSIDRIQAKKTRDSLTPSERDKLAKLHALMKKQRKTGNYKMESADLEEKYAVKYTHPTDKKSGKTTGPLSKAAAEKKAAMGNRVDKVGGKYTVIRHVGESVQEVDEAKLSAMGIHNKIADRNLLIKAIKTAEKMGGNMTGAVREIEKMKKGLSKHKAVQAALRQANESVRSADKKPQNFRDPETGKTKVRMVPVDRDISSRKANESVEMNEAVDFEKMSKELLKHKSKGVEFEKAAAFTRVMFMNSSIRVQDKAMKGLLTLLKNIDDLNVKTTLTKILKDNGFKVRGGKVMREEVELEERVNSVKYSRKDFENTKKGDKLEIKWGDSISSGRSATFVVAGKSASKKYNVEKLRLEPEGKKGGVKFFLRSRNGGDATFSIGDMAAIMTSIKKV